MNDPTFLLTLIALYFTYFQWKKTTREKRIHLLKVLKTQLDCLGPWMGTSGEGYGEELTEDQKFDNANPFKLIYNTASESLISMNSFDEITNVDISIIGELNQLYYDLVRIQNIQNFRNLYITSDIKISKSLAGKLGEYCCNNNYKSMQKFSNTISNTEEQAMLHRLLHYGKVLHCEVIGNKNRAGRQHWEKLNEWASSQLKPSDDWVFVIITFLFLGGSLYALNLIQESNPYFWLAFILLGILINFMNGAIDKFAGMLLSRY